MTLVEELRKRAEYARLEMLARPKDYVLGQTAYNARWKALLEAADLVEADPLYKAAPKMRDQLAEIVRVIKQDGDTAGVRIWDLLAPTEKLLAALPKEE